MIRLALVTMAACLAFGAQGAAAHGADGFDSNRTKVDVTIRTSELRDPARAEANYRRLYAAAQKACQSEGEGPKYRQADDRACEDEAMDAAVNTVDSAPLTSVYVRQKASRERQTDTHAMTATASR